MLNPHQFPPPQGSPESGPDPARLGRPHAIPSAQYPGMHHIYDEKGLSQGMSSKEQADRFVIRRTGQVKAMATRRHKKAQGG
jgi:hypothetical protein